MMIVLIITESWLYEQFLPFSILSLYVVVYIKQCTYFCFLTIFFIITFLSSSFCKTTRRRIRVLRTRRTHRLFFSLVFLVCQNQSIKVFYTIMVYKPILIQCCAMHVLCVQPFSFYITFKYRKVIAISSQLASIAIRYKEWYIHNSFSHQPHCLSSLYYYPRYS